MISSLRAKAEFQWSDPQPLAGRSQRFPSKAMVTWRGARTRGGWWAHQEATHPNLRGLGEEPCFLVGGTNVAFLKCAEYSSLSPKWAWSGTDFPVTQEPHVQTHGEPLQTCMHEVSHAGAWCTPICTPTQSSTPRPDRQGGPVHTAQATALCCSHHHGGVCCPHRLCTPISSPKHPHSQVF